MENKRWFDRKEVCAILGMEARQFRDAVEAGRLPRGVKRGKRMVWSKEDIEAMHWLEQHRGRLRPSKPKV
jgi:predicted DNA-binding transcriptional regulator AlpA